MKIGRDNTRALLFNILPKEMVQELQMKPHAKVYKMVTVMYIDLIHSSQNAENQNSILSSEELNNIFIKFDKIIQSHSTERIKTDGDSYICIAGIPKENKTNPIDIVLVGLEIQRYVGSLNKKYDEDNWKLRMGIHTGELFSILDSQKESTHDIWGKAVDGAIRIGKTRQTERINISCETYNQIQPYFNCIQSGKEAVKGDEQHDIFSVKGIKPELCVDEKGIEPNKKFWKYVKLNINTKIDYRKAEKHIIKKLQNELPEALYYHGINHTLNVYKSIEKIALSEGIIGNDIYILKLAALYHDAGFTKKYESNEPIGAKMAEKDLPQYGFSDEEIKKIIELIFATKRSHAPKNHLQEIIYDADLDYLGREDFHHISDKLKRELKERNKITTDRQWDEVQVKFLSQHRYYTAYQKKMRDKGKEKHLDEIKKRLKDY